MGDSQIKAQLQQTEAILPNQRELFVPQLFLLCLGLVCCVVNVSRGRECFLLQHQIENNCLIPDTSFVHRKLGLVYGPMQNNFGQAQGKTKTQQPLGTPRVHKDLKQEQVSPKPSPLLLFLASQGCLKRPKCRYDRPH